MDAPAPHWPSPRFENAGDPGLPSYVACGPLPAPRQVSHSRYRDAGSVALEPVRDRTGNRPGVVDAFREGGIRDGRARDDTALAGTIAARDERIVRTDIADRADLDTLRDAVGLPTCCVGHGCGAIHDLQTSAWWSPADWRERISLPAGPVPRHHVAIPSSRGPDGEWLHPRGTREFGWADHGLHGVGTAHRDAAIELQGRLMALQASGGPVPGGERIRMPGLSRDMRWRRRGALDDPDFDNTHIDDIEWPATARGAH